jgi:D-lactate dehydrogenase
MEKAGIEMIRATGANQCCGLPYRSQGLLDTAESKALALSKMLEDVSENGKYPIIFDASPCVEQVLSYLPRHVRAYEACDYVSRFILPRVKLERVKESVLLHITCSTRKMDLAETMLNLAQACAEEVIVPNDIECCAFAGNKGILKPELNAHALRNLKKQVPRRCQRGFSNSVSCEIGLSNHSGVPYQSLLYLVDEVSRPLK